MDRFRFSLLPLLCALCASVINPSFGASQRPGPYAFVLTTGPQRGQSYCYVCETADRPAVIVFARSLSEPLGRLVQGLDKAVADHKSVELRAWVTFLHADQAKFDPQVVQWAQQHAIRAVPLGVFEDAGGPPSYRLAPDADVMVLLYVRRKVEACFTYRAGELKDAQVADILKVLPRITTKK